MSENTKLASCRQLLPTSADTILRFIKTEVETIALQMSIISWAMAQDDLVNTGLLGEQVHLASSFVSKSLKTRFGDDREKFSWSTSVDVNVSATAEEFDALAGEQLVKLVVALNSLRKYSNRRITSSLYRFMGLP